MAENTSSPRQSRWLFILVCANFTMLAVLFIGLGILLYQSISLVGSLKSDLQRAEASVAQLRERVERIEPEAAVERIVGAAVGSIREEVRQAVSESEPLAALSTVPESIERASTAAGDIADTLQQLDADAIAQRVSYELLKGLGEGLEAAAEKRKPEG
jgi:preprotein translocase subunit SecF